MKINKKVHIYTLKKAFFTPHRLVMETSRNFKDTGKI